MTKQKVCRLNISVYRPVTNFKQWYTLKLARVAELVDAHGSGPCIARCGDSSSLPGTINSFNCLNISKPLKNFDANQQKSHCDPVAFLLPAYF